MAMLGIARASKEPEKPETCVETVNSGTHVELLKSEAHVELVKAPVRIEPAEEERFANAKLAISIARKMGATIWLVPEDINEVRSRLITTFIGSLMSTHERGGS